MDPLDVAYVFAAAVPLSFAAGVLFHKYVGSEAAAIKKHVTDEIAEVRVDIADGLKKLAAKV